MGTVPAGLIAVVLLATAAAAVGCGGDDDESRERPEASATTAPRTTTTPAGGAPSESPPPRGDTLLTAAEYRSTVNRLCREDKAAVDRLGNIDDARSITPYLRRAIRYARKREPLYERLRPPTSLRADHRRSIRLNDRGERTLTGLLARIERGGDPAEEFGKIAPALARVISSGNRLARRMGTKDCIVEVPSPGAQPPRSSS